MERNKNKLSELLLSPIGLFGLVILVVVIILIVASVIRMVTERPDDQTTYEYDPASQTEIAWMPITDGDDKELPIFVGFTDLINNGMTATQMNVFKDAIKKYAASNDMVLERVSYLKDSYVLAASYVFDFEVVLNIDGATVKVRADSSKGWKNILGMVVTLRDEDDNKLYELKVDEKNFCEYYGNCDGLETGT